MRIDNKLGLTSSAEQAMHKYLFEDIYDFWGYRYAKETYGVFGGDRCKCKSHTDNDIVEGK